MRFAVHTGESVERDGDYLGPAVNRAARLRAVAQGGEVLVSGSTARLVADHLPAHVRLVELGDVRLKDLERPEPTLRWSARVCPNRRSVGTVAMCGAALLAERGVTRKEAEVLEGLASIFPMLRSRAACMCRSERWRAMCRRCCASSRRRTATSWRD